MLLFFWLSSEVLYVVAMSEEVLIGNGDSVSAILGIHSRHFFSLKLDLLGNFTGKLYFFLLVYDVTQDCSSRGGRGLVLILVLLGTCVCDVT